MRVSRCNVEMGRRLGSRGVRRSGKRAGTDSEIDPAGPHVTQPAMLQCGGTICLEHSIGQPWASSRADSSLEGSCEAVVHLGPIRRRSEP